MSNNPFPGIKAINDYFENEVGDFILYGCGNIGRRILAHLLEMNIQPLGICDRDVNLIGKTLCGFTVLSPESLKNKFNSDIPLVVTIAKYQVASTNERLELEKSLPGHTVTFLPPAVWQSFIMNGIATSIDGTIYNGALFSADINAPGWHISKGERMTPGQSQSAEKTCFILGDSTALSSCVSDEHSLASFLQEKFNSENNLIKVRNFGGTGMAGISENLLLCPDSLDMRKGDIILVVKSLMSIDIPSPGRFFSIITTLFRICQREEIYPLLLILPVMHPRLFENDGIKKGIQSKLYNWYINNSPSLDEAWDYWEKDAQTKENILADLMKSFNANGCPAIYAKLYVEAMPQSERIFMDLNHLSPRANQVVAEKIYDDYFARLKPAVDENTAKTWGYTTLGNYLYSQKSAQPDVTEWLDMVRRDRGEKAGVFGAVVMNCNPFTKGHLFLIEQAAAKVDFLHVFVVEEDRSMFPFADRIRLVRDGIGHLGEKAMVFPSGKFVLSTLTFKDYFAKESIIGKVDPSYDIIFFGAIIARELNISQRFIGEEPFCAVTSQYNDAMLKILPFFNITMTVIPRTNAGTENAISASQVRSHFLAGDWNAVQEMTPASTYQYLREHRDAFRDDCQTTA